MDFALRPKANTRLPTKVGRRIGGASAWVAPVNMQLKRNRGKEHVAPYRSVMQSSCSFTERAMRMRTLGVPIRRRRIECVPSMTLD